MYKQTEKCPCGSETTVEGTDGVGVSNAIEDWRKTHRCTLGDKHRGNAGATVLSADPLPSGKGYSYFGFRPPESY